MKNIYKDVMLNKIAFVDGKNHVKFELYDSNNGNDLGAIICRNVFAFNFHTAFEPNEESFPCLVLDVNMTKLENTDISEKFEKLSYRYKFSDDLAIPKSNNYHLLRIEGGPIDISIICQEILIM